jgi:DNA-binding NarL/FixJ family response regulator
MAAETPEQDPDPIRLLIIDDHPAVPWGVAVWLSENAPDITVVGQVPSLATALAAIEQLRPDVLLLDIMLHGKPDGIELLRRLAGIPDPPAAIMYTSYEAPAFARDVIELGASGYLLKDDPLRTVAEAVRDAAAGKRSFAAGIDRMAHGAAPAPTDRELEIIRLAANGLTNDEIGHQLETTSKAVECALSRIFTRYGIAGRGQLDAFAVGQGWLLGERLPVRR